ncbi:MAG: Hpt domain-containing protein [Frankiaceae bacterium]
MTAGTDTDTEPAAHLVAAAGKERAIQLRLEDLLGPAEGWSASLVEALITSFLCRTAEYLESLGLAIGRHDVAAVTRDSHSLKGMASNLGATDLAALSEALESCARIDELSPAAGLLLRLRTELEGVRPAMQAVLALAR